jgi:glycerol-3-phosphate O-acyltransferase
LLIRGGWHRFGYAVVNIGTPVSIRAYMKARNIAIRSLGKEARIEIVREFAKTLMVTIGHFTPAVPVAVVSNVFLENPERPLSPTELRESSFDLMDRLEARGAHVYIPRKDRHYAVKVGLRALALRHLIIKTDGLYRAAPEEIRLLNYYANSIAHLLT